MPRTSHTDIGETKNKKQKTKQKKNRKLSSSSSFNEFINPHLY